MDDSHKCIKNLQAEDAYNSTLSELELYQKLKKVKINRYFILVPKFV